MNKTKKVQKTRIYKYICVYVYSERKKGRVGGGGLEREVVGRKVLPIEGDRNHYGDCVGLGFEWGGGIGGNKKRFK